MRRKSIFSFLLSLILITGCMIPVYAGGDVAVEENSAEIPRRVVNEEYFADQNVITASSHNVQPPKDFPVSINAKSAILIDVDSGKVLLEYNSHEKLPPASVTKIMSLLLYMEAIDSGKMKLTDSITASRDAAGKGGSQIWLKEGEQMTVDELLKATAVSSANDACVALAEKIAGSEEAFVKMMNNRAQELGMKDTNFENCTGLDDSAVNHLTSAYDISLMSRELLHHELICNYTTIWMDSLRGGKTELVNTNKLVRFYNGTTGLKTGTTSKAGHCLSASAKRGDVHLLAVVMGSETGALRFESAKNLLNYGFSNWSVVKPAADKSLITPVTVLKGVKSQISPVIGECAPVLVKSGQEGELTQTVELAANVEAPVEKGQILGKIIYKIGGETVGESMLTAPESVEVLDFWKALKRLLCSMS